MPVVPQTPYPTVEQVANRTRAIVLDSFQGGKGRILTDSATFTTEFINGALEELQEKIRNNGVITLIKDNVILTPITPLQSATTSLAEPNPAVQVNVSYAGYFDGLQMHDVPALPPDCIEVLEVRDRATGTQDIFVPLSQPQQGIGSVWQCAYLSIWEYRGDAIWMPGATQTRDLQIRYQTQLQPIVAPTTDSPWTDVSINVLATVNALAWLTAYQYAVSRGGAAAAAIKPMRDQMMRYVVNRYVRRDQTIHYSRGLFGGPLNQWRSGGINSQ